MAGTVLAGVVQLGLFALAVHHLGWGWTTGLVVLSVVRKWLAVATISMGFPAWVYRPATAAVVGVNTYAYGGYIVGSGLGALDGISGLRTGAVVGGILGAIRGAWIAARYGPRAREASLNIADMTGAELGYLMAAGFAVFAADARHHVGWSAEWRISVAVGLVVAAATIRILARPLTGGWRHPVVLFAATVAGGTALGVAAGTMDLTSWERGMLTELAVGLVFVGGVEVAAEGTVDAARARDAMYRESEREDIERVSLSLLRAEADTLRRNAERDPDFGAWEAILTAGRSKLEAAAVAKRQEARQRAADELRAVGHDLIARVAAEHGLSDEVVEAMRHFVYFDLFDLALDGHDVDADDLEAELLAIARLSREYRFPAADQR